MSTQPKVAIIGGGTGSYVVASGLSKKNVDVTMLMTMVDDGGSNRIIRDEFGLLPTSGIRQGIVALSQDKSILRKLFTYRFHQGGEGLKGMTFGNLFMAAMTDIMGSQKEALEATCQLLQVKGQILPISYDDVRLVATYEDESKVTGEHLIDEPEHDGKLKIINLKTQPTAQISPEAQQAILEADLIVIGPGDFYTNSIANLVIKGVPEALHQTKAQVIFVSNLMTKYGETYDYKLSDFVEDLAKYLPLSDLDYLLVNDNYDFPTQILEKYQQQNSIPVKDNLENYQKLPKSVKILRKNLLSNKIAATEKGDSLQRSMIRHDANLLAESIYDFFGKDKKTSTK
jgi:uncharacterized cofD-like protein